MAGHLVVVNTCFAYLHCLVCILYFYKLWYFATFGPVNLKQTDLLHIPLEILHTMIYNKLIVIMGKVFDHFMFLRFFMVYLNTFY